MFYFTENTNYSLKAIKTYEKIAPIKKKKGDNVKVLVIRLNYKIEKNFLKSFKNLKFIISSTTGLDHIDKKYCKDKNIKILSLNNVKEKIKNIYSTADLTIALLISLVRKVNLSNRYVVNTGVALPTGRWSFCTVVKREGTPSTSNIDFFVDGVQQTTNETGWTLDFPNPAGTIRIGGRSRIRGGDENWYLNGRIGTTLMYNRALTADEVLYNYNATRMGGV